MVDKVKTPIQEWYAEFCRTVNTRDGTMSMDIYLIRRQNPQSMITISVPHGDRDLPKLLVDALNNFAGYEPTFDRSLTFLFHGPWKFDQRYGDNIMVATSRSLEPARKMIEGMIANSERLENELKNLREIYDQLQRAYSVQAQVIMQLREALANRPKGEEFDPDKNPDLFASGGGKEQRHFDVV